MAENPQTRISIEVGEEDDRYHRQSLISWWDQKRLRDARIMVAGAGALGNELVKNLVLMGIGHVTVVDMDTIENSNLARCVFFRPEDEGRDKAETLAERAGELNSDVKVEFVSGDIRLSVGLGMFDDVDLVLGGLDNREARMYINQACWKTSTPWIDGAIEGLMGVVRMFIPPETACYECTMSERDHELVSARRSCTLLTREEMLEGKVPTNATSASIIAGIQVQEAVKLIHRDELGEPALAGAGYNFVGLTHDSYLVRYQPRDDCFSHDTYEMDRGTSIPTGIRFSDLLSMARRGLGDDAILEFEQEIAVRASCQNCESSCEFLCPVDALGASDGLCPDCDQPWQLEFTHSVDDESPLLELTPEDLELPMEDVIVARSGMERAFFRLDGPEVISIESQAS